MAAYSCRQFVSLPGAALAHISSDSLFKKKAAYMAAFFTSLKRYITHSNSSAVPY